MKTTQLNRYNSAVGRQLREARRAVKLTIKKASELSGIPIPTMNRYEAGETSVPDDRLHALCKLYGINQDSITSDASLITSMPKPHDDNSRLLSAFAKLSKEDKTTVLTLTESLSKQSGGRI